MDTVVLVIALLDARRRARMPAVLGCLTGKQKTKKSERERGCENSLFGGHVN